MFTGLSDMHLAGFAPAFTLSLCDSECSRKPPVPIASVVRRKLKNQKKDILFNEKTMKKTLLILLTTLTSLAYGQDKYNYVHYNKLTEIKGTEFVIATIENMGKMFTTNSK